MAAIYLILFLPLTAGGGLVCLCVPSWRRYSFAGLVCPMAFGIASMGGLLCNVVLSEVGSRCCLASLECDIEPHLKTP